MEDSDGKNMDGSCACIPAYRERMQQCRRLNHLFEMCTNKYIHIYIYTYSVYIYIYIYVVLRCDVGLICNACSHCLGFAFCGSILHTSAPPLSACKTNAHGVPSSAALLESGSLCSSLLF